MTHLTSFQARNFRTLRNVSVDELPGIVILYGEHDTGKSNFLLAVQCWLQLLQAIGLEGLFQSSQDKRIDREIHQKSFSQVTHGEVEFELGGGLEISGQLFEFQIEITSGEVRLTKAIWPNGKVDEPVSSQEPEAKLLAGFLASPWMMVGAERRFVEESLGAPGEQLDPCGSNVKRHLFWAAHSTDPQVRSLYHEQFCSRVRTGPFASLPRPILALDGSRIKLLIDSTRIEECGTGFRQWAAVCALLAASGAVLAGVEEPEAHLSWEGQLAVFQALRKFQAAGSPQQLFLTTHSPLGLEASCDGTWFEVGKGREGTVVHRRQSRERLATLFPELPNLPVDDRVLQVTQGGRLRLPEKAVRHLDLRPDGHLYCVEEDSPVRGVRLITDDEMGRYLCP